MRLKTLLHTKFAHNTSWIIASRIYQLGVNLAVSVLTSRYLGPENYGLLQYAASFAALLTAFCTLGIGDVMVPALIASPREQGQLLGTAIVFRFGASLLSMTTVCLAVWAINPDQPLTVWVAAIYGSSMVLQSLEAVKYFYQKQLMSKVTGLLTMATRTVVALYKILLLLFQKDVLWFAFSNVLDHALFGVLLLICYRRHRQPGQQLRFDRSAGRTLLSQSCPFILSGFMVALYGQMDKIMIKHLLTETQVGHYAVALLLCNVWTFVLTALVDSARPVILEQFSGNEPQYRQKLAQLYRALMYISFAVAAAMTLLAKPLVQLLYGEAYLGAVNALRILPWGTAFSYLGVARSIWTVPHGQQHLEKYLAFIGAAANVALNLLLIPTWGICGAAVAAVLTQIITNFLCGLLFRPLRQNTALILRALRPGPILFREK